MDWNNLPAAQAALLEGRQLHLWDPCRAVPDQPGLLRMTVAETDTQPPAHAGQLVVAHWRRLEPQPATLRVAVPRLVLGLGCRKDVPAGMVIDAVRNLLEQHQLEPLALAITRCTITSTSMFPSLLRACAVTRAESDMVLLMFTLMLGEPSEGDPPT